MWENLNWLGFEGISAAPNLTVHFYWLLKAVNFTKFYGLASLLFLGFSAWLFLRQLRFANWVCVLGGLAAALNSNTFSNVCWGLSTRAITLACTFLALAALVSGQRRRPLWKALLAGLAVGMSIMEGFDVGAIYSLYVAAFGVFLVWNEGEGSHIKKIVRGAARVALVAAFAAFVATYTLSTLIGTQIKGVVGMGQDAESKSRRWAEATAWSTPPAETFRVLIPGVFGYRMDTAGGGQYWGTAGRQQDFEKNHAGFPRHSGSGEYAGVLVVLVALWAVALSFRRKEDNAFTAAERRFIWFWAGLGFLSLLLAWGYHAPFYRLIYSLPFFSTIRNPMKFMHPFHLSLLILFGFGLQALARRYLDGAREPGRKWLEQLKTWWGTSRGFEKKWVLGSLVAVGAAFVGWLLYNASRDGLVAFLKREGFGEGAGRIAQFSHNEVALFILVLALAVAWLACVLAGVFTGRRAKWAAIIAGIFLVVDMGRANKPWIIYYNYHEKLAPNPVLDFLRERPHEHRVAMAPLQLPPQLNDINAVYGEWLQNSFQYYNIQSLDIIQMPRQPEDMVAYNNTVRSVPVRMWQLSNTRYLLTAAMAAEFMNQQFDPAQRRFRVHAAFDFAPKAGLTNATRVEDLEVVLRTNGNFAIVEFTGALPRAKLYSNWQIPANDQAALQTLINPAFDPAQTVLVSAPVAPPKPEDAAQPAGEVKITQYAPTKLRLESSSAVPTVLLLNDRYAPHWKVWVDGKPDTVLRCNYIVRGVALSPGRHEIEFRFEPPVRALWVSVVALAISLGIGLFLAITAERPSRPAPDPIRSRTA